MKANTVSSAARRHPAPPGTISTLAILLAAILATPAKAVSDPWPCPIVAAWSIVDTGISLVEVTWGNGVWVAVGMNGTIIYSLDALN